MAARSAPAAPGMGDNWDNVLIRFCRRLLPGIAAADLQQLSHDAILRARHLVDLAGQLSRQPPPCTTQLGLPLIMAGCAGNGIMQDPPDRVGTDIVTSSHF